MGAPLLDSKQEMQLRVVVETAKATRGIDLVVERTPQGVPWLVYQKDVLLVRAADADALARHVTTDLVPGEGVGDIQLRKLRSGTVLGTIQRLNGIEGLRQDIATPNHVVSICPLNMCPADEPVPPPRFTVASPVPPLTGGNGGEGVTVDVVDTGLMENIGTIHPWLADIPTGGGTASVDGQINEGIGKTWIMEYAGHGTFIASVLRCAAPKVSVYVDNALQFAGATMENTLGQVLLDRLAGNPDIISLSAGGPTLNDRRQLGLEPFFAALTDDGCTTLLVAAAGNDGVSQKFWPAAYATEAPEAVISVGALRKDLGGRACFSNHGSWVRVFAAGERFIHAFPPGRYKYIDPPSAVCRYYRTSPLYPGCTCVTAPPQGMTVSFTGLARWSGTSFSTPLVAGRIATHMTTTGQSNARLAARHLLNNHAQPLVDKDGVRLSVLV